MLKAELRVVGGKHHGKVIPLHKGKFLVGREQDCQLRPNSELVSRHHCVFTMDDYTVRLRDLGSTNGTFVNNERISGQVMLKLGDRVHIGKLDFTVNIKEVSESHRSETPLPSSLSTLLSAETAELAGDTSTEFELPVSQPLVDPAVPGAGADSDTTILLPQQEQAPQGQALQPPPPTLDAYPQHQPGPSYFQPMGAYPGYPYQQPMMPFPPMGMYPQPMPMPYAMPAPAYPQPQVQTPTPPPQQSSSSSTVPVPPVRLPKPEETGVAAAPPPPPPEAPGTNGEAKAPAAAEVKPSEKAAEIIRQHLHRRPTKPS